MGHVTVVTPPFQKM